MAAVTSANNYGTPKYFILHLHPDDHQNLIKVELGKPAMKVFTTPGIVIIIQDVSVEPNYPILRSYKSDKFNRYVELDIAQSYVKHKDNQNIPKKK